ncbi:MAG: hypothetical protein Q8Q85_14180 [Gemmatimonadales bacterium]|nr:hypothetical protein [Gemmatimonadales bacterium]
MRRIGQVAVALVLPAVLAAEAASAQVAGIPVYYNPGGGTGFSVAANVGRPNDDGGGGTAWALTGGLSNGPFSLTASYGHRNEGDVGTLNGLDYATYGGTLSFRVLGGGLLPLSIAPQVGIGISKVGGVTDTEIPIGVGILISPPLFPIKPWIAPRVQLSRISGTGITSTNATSFGLSVGANFNLLLGLGFHAAVDMLKVSKDIDPTEPTATTIGVGAHFNFRVPMM